MLANYFFQAKTSPARLLQVGSSVDDGVAGINAAFRGKRMLKPQKETLDPTFR